MVRSPGWPRGLRWLWTTTSLVQIRPGVPSSHFLSSPHCGLTSISVKVSRLYISHFGESYNCFHRPGSKLTLMCKISGVLVQANTAVPTRCIFSVFQKSKSCSWLWETDVLLLCAACSYSLLHQSSNFKSHLSLQEWMESAPLSLG